MKVLLITNDWTPKKGGISTYLINFVKNFPEEIIVFGPNWIEGDGTYQSSSKIILPTRRTILEISKVIEENGIDHILMGSSNPQFLLVRFLLKLNIPISMIAHGAEFNIVRFIPILNNIMRSSMSSLNTVYTISNFSLRKLEKMTETKVVLIGAGASSFDSDIQDETSDIQKVLVGVSSRFVPRKKIDWVIEVCSNLLDEGYDVELYIYGHGRLKEKLKKLSQLFSVKTTFYPNNELEDISDFYKKIDIFAMPSHSRFFGLEYEGLGLVYLEAASHGLPVITGSSGGSVETIIPGKTGFVADTKNHLYDAIKYFLDNPDSIGKFGLEGKKFITENYSWTGVVDRYKNSLEFN